MKLVLVWPNGETENVQASSCRGLTRKASTGGLERPLVIIYDGFLPHSLTERKKLLDHLRKANAFISVEKVE